MKKRMYPAKVKVRDVHYDITLTECVDPTDSGDTITRGYCETKEKLIVLDSTLSEQELFETFLHELLHAAAHEHAIKLKHKTIYALEGPLAQIIRDNFIFVPKR